MEPAHRARIAHRPDPGTWRQRSTPPRKQHRVRPHSLKPSNLKRARRRPARMLRPRSRRHSIRPKRVPRRSMYRSILMRSAAPPAPTARRVRQCGSKAAWPEPHRQPANSSKTRCSHTEVRRHLRNSGGALTYHEFTPERRRQHGLSPAACKRRGNYASLAPPEPPAGRFIQTASQKQSIATIIRRNIAICSPSENAPHP